METFLGELRSKRLVRRRFALFVAALVPGLALADDLALARQVMGSALSELSTHGRVTIVLNGTETDADKTNTIYVALAMETFIVDNRPVPYLEVLEYKNNEVLNRSAADGARFWNYDTKDREYTSTEYAT